MKIKSDTELHQRLEEVKKLASRMMHMHYCEHDTEGIISCFSDRFSWMGAGEQEYLSGRQACVERFRKFGKTFPTVISGMRNTMPSAPWRAYMLSWDGCG